MNEQQPATEQQNVNVDPLAMPYIEAYHNVPSFDITFHQEGKRIGKLDFNGPILRFEGDVEESAKIFIEWLALSFEGRLAKERERCAKLCDGADKSTILPI